MRQCVGECLGTRVFLCLAFESQFLSLVIPSKMAPSAGVKLCGVELYRLTSECGCSIKDGKVAGPCLSIWPYARRKKQPQGRTMRQLRWCAHRRL